MACKCQKSHGHGKDQDSTSATSAKSRKRRLTCLAAQLEGAAVSSWQLSCLCWLLSNHSQSGQAAPSALLSPCQAPSFDLAVWPRMLCDQQAPVSKQRSRLTSEMACSMGLLNGDPHQMSWICDLTQACLVSCMLAGTNTGLLTDTSMQNFE